MIVFEVLQIPTVGKGDDYFWANELFVSTADSEAAQGKLTGRHHLAFQAADRLPRTCHAHCSISKSYFLN